MRFVTTTAPGLEGLLAEELRELGLEPEPPVPAAVVFEGDWAAASRVLIRSRIASRVLIAIKQFSARSEAMLYDQVRRIVWTDYVPAGATLAVFAHGTTAGTSYPLHFAPLKIKDGICDEIRKLGRERPDVSRARPDVRVEALFAGRRCELSIDLTGEPLHRRGWRLEGGEAPLRENRAAALLRFAGAGDGRPLLDPFCGSGTIAIEAALLATRRAPALARPLDAFTATRLFPESREALAAERVRAEVHGSPRAAFPIRASDASEDVIRAAQANAARAGVAEHIEFAVEDARAITPAGSLVVTNPPYGERIGSMGESTELISAFTRQLKHHAKGARLVLVLPRGPLEHAVGLKPSRKLAFENGPIPSRFLAFDLY